MFDMDIIRRTPIMDYIEGERKKTSKGYLFKKCPFCSKHWHFYVNTKLNVFNSFNSCTNGGGVIDFVAKIRNIKPNKAIYIIACDIGLQADKNIKPIPRHEKEFNNALDWIEEKRIDILKNKFFTWLKKTGKDDIFNKAYVMEDSQLIPYIYTVRLIIFGR